MERGAPAFPTLAIETIGLGIGLGLGLGIAGIGITGVGIAVCTQVEHIDCHNSHLIRSIHASRVEQCLKSSTENGVGTGLPTVLIAQKGFSVSGHHKVQSSDISEYTSSD